MASPPAELPWPPLTCRSYGGLTSALAIEFDTWLNPDMGDVFYNHISVQAGGPGRPLGAHQEQTLAVTALSPLLYPQGLTDGKAHVVRVRFTPGHHLELLADAPAADPNHLQFWVEEGMVAEPTPPHTQAMGTWMRPGTGTLVESALHPV